MLTNVVVSPDVMSACWSHALITEKEEIMGLLVGKMVENTLVISAMKVIRRLTKQRDRVEIDNRDLIAGAEFAESLPGSLSVFGWYHSHPHNTVHLATLTSPPRPAIKKWTKTLWGSSSQCLTTTLRLA